MMFKHPFNWFNKFGTIPESYTEAMSYEEQIMWLCKEIKENEGFIDEFRKEFSDVSTILQEMQQAINDNTLAITDLQSNKQDKLTAGFNIQIRKFEEGTSEEETEIDTEPIIQDSLIIGGSYIQLGDKEVTDFIDLTPIELANTAYIIVYAKAGESYEFNGHFDLATFNNNLEITAINKNKFSEDFFDYIECDIDTNFVVSFYQTDIYVPEVRSYINNTYIYDKLNSKQDKLIAGTGIDITGNVISANGGTASLEPIDLSSNIVDNYYIDLSGNLGDTVNLTPVSSAQYAYFIKETIPNESFNIEGDFILAEIDSNNVIANKITNSGTPEEPYTYTCNDGSLPSNSRIIITYSKDIFASTPKVYDVINSEYIYTAKNDVEGIQKLRADLYLDNSSPDTMLDEGLYYANGYHVYINNVIENDFNEALFYVKEDTIYMICSSGSYHKGEMHQFYYYDSGNHEWKFGFMNAKTNWSEVIGKPTINNFTAPLYLTSGTGTTGLADGLYYTGSYGVYVDNVVNTEFSNALILANGNDVLYVIASPVTNHTTYLYRELYYNNGSWTMGNFNATTTWNNVFNKPAGMENYSTTEQVVGTWTDGKPLYQRVITGSLPTVTVDGNEAHIDTTIAQDISYSFVSEAFFEQGTNNYRTFFPYNDFNYNSTFQTFTHLYSNAILINNLVRVTNSSVANSGKNFYITVRYTKTTD